MSATFARQSLDLPNRPGGNDAEPTSQPRNEAMFAVLQRSAERMKDVPVSGSTEETLKLIRAARAGKMWGSEPIE